jgi:hypothetical protein
MPPLIRFFLPIGLPLSTIRQHLNLIQIYVLIFFRRQSPEWLRREIQGSQLSAVAGRARAENRENSNFRGTFVARLLLV